MAAWSLHHYPPTHGSNPSQRQVANISEPCLDELVHAYNNHRWAGPWPGLSFTCWGEVEA